MERLRVFLPSIIIIASIGIAVLLYVKWFEKRNAEFLKSADWLSKNKYAVMLKYAWPSVLISAPTLEEVIFRAPIIVAFGALTSNAWIGVIVSSTIFAIPHWRGSKVTAIEFFEANEKNQFQTDDVLTTINQLQKTNGVKIRIRKIANVVLAFLTGMLSGYYGIKYQSLWVSVGIHFAWNLFIAALLPLAVILLVYVIILPVLTVYLFLKNKYESRKFLKRRKSRRGF